MDWNCLMRNRSRCYVKSLMKMFVNVRFTFTGRSMREDEDSALLDYMLDCWNKQKDVTTKQPDVKLVSAIDQLMKPLGLVDAFVTLKRVRLQCRCHQGPCAGLAAYSQRHAVDLYL